MKENRQVVIWWIVDVFLALIPLYFWASVILKFGLGADYFIDLVIVPLIESAWGRVLLLLLICGVPGAGLGLNIYLRKGLVRKYFRYWELVFLGLVICGLGITAITFLKLV